MITEAENIPIVGKCEMAGVEFFFFVENSVSFHSYNLSILFDTTSKGVASVYFLQ